MAGDNSAPGKTVSGLYLDMSKLLLGETFLRVYLHGTVECKIKYPTSFSLMPGVFNEGTSLSAPCNSVDFEVSAAVDYRFLLFC